MLVILRFAFGATSSTNLKIPISQNQKFSVCLKNYFKIAFRNLWKRKGYSFINILGLTIGMASAILILLWIQNEMSYDRFYKKSDRIYTMYNRDKFNGEIMGMEYHA